ncbi:YihY/virulence factor BrkB family protein [Nocardioides sp. URHA0020]|uniref:YihY/virulence factor BrkB family protein n=1 Tax=Nocardioides sp. URHA0020 TaxID=1380392 RepID=UPI0006883079|nr:YihY/virulence factor BrkB family protein [Nocardioides sp. URHA0020]
MPSIKERVADLRKRRPLVDHVVRMQEHYGGVNAGQQAGAVTYFAFLSFFPILALSFLVVGWIAVIYPRAESNLTTAINQLLPNMIGPGDDQISLDDFQGAQTTIGVVALVSLAAVLYAGLGWLSGMRAALEIVFEVPKKDQPNFVFGKLRDLLTMVLIGVVLIVSVGVSSLVSRYSTKLLDLVGLGTELSPLLQVLTVALGILASMLLFVVLFKLLAEPATPTRSLWSGALLGALAFEVLKRLSGLLLASTKDQPAFQAFGIALILIIWINYFSRVVLYAAAWAHTSAAARAARPAPTPAPVEGPPSPPLRQRGSELEYPWAATYAAGAATMLGLVALTRRLTRTSGRDA